MKALRQDYLALLIPVFDDPAEAEAHLQTIVEAVFALALDQWERNPDVWPPHRSYDVFREWFDVEFHSMVLDTVAGRIIKERY